MVPPDPTEDRRARAVRRLCERLDLDPEPPQLAEALVHPSYANERHVGDNQRLEFLGDAVLGLCVSELLMKRFATVDEGDLTVMRAALVNADALGLFAREVDLGSALLLGRGAEASGERNRTNVLADALEAVIGAVYLDGGLDAARNATLRVLGDQLATFEAAGGIQRDAKSRLQEWSQARGWPTPRYEVVTVEGPPHARWFTVEVELSTSAEDELVMGRGCGKSKKEAEQAAAASALSAVEET